MDKNVLQEIEAYILLGNFEMIQSMCDAIVKAKSTLEDILPLKRLTELRVIARRLKVKYYTSMDRKKLSQSIINSFEEKKHVLTIEKVIGRVSH